jgi:hypothetical protein
MRLMAVAALLLLAACGSSTPAKSVPGTGPVVLPGSVAGIGDNCLIGTWTVSNETDITTIGTSVVTLSGLAGAKMTITAAGGAIFDYTGSQPMAGAYNGQNLTETYAGTMNFQDQVTRGTLMIAFVSSRAVATAALDGVVQGTGPLVAQTFSSPVYACTATRLSYRFTDSGNSDAFTRSG